MTEFEKYWEANKPEGVLLRPFIEKVAKQAFEAGHEKGFEVGYDSGMSAGYEAGVDVGKEIG